MEINRCPHCMQELTGPKGGTCPFCGFDAKKSPQPAEAMPRNTVLNGKYLVGDVLGRGGFGITYIGFDLSLESRVAIKEYYPSGAAMRREGESELYWSSTYKFRSSREDAKNYFLKEARKMARVENIPSVVRVRETFLANETAYIVMDYVEGETLKARLRREGAMTYTACYALLRPMMQDLCRIHRQGVIHRDISPDNIMIQRDGSIKLLDLGAAKDLNKHSDEVSVPVGKNGYSPMEQYLNNGSIGPWTDVYALCATIYYACYGVRVPQSLERLEQDTLRFDLPTREPIPPYVVEALRKGLAVRAADRTQSVDELLDQLEEEQTTILRPALQPGAEPAPAPAAKPAEKIRPTRVRSAAPARPAGKGRVIGIGAAAAVAVVGALCFAFIAAKPGTAPVTRDVTPAASVEETASSEEGTQGNLKADSASADSVSFSSADAELEYVTEQPIEAFEGSGIYTGQWKNGEPSGYGKCELTGETPKGTSREGCFYEGNWENGCANGYGKYTWFYDYAIYEGNWVNGKRSGQGKIVYSSGEYYEGDWENDKRTGQGKMVYGDDVYYEGDWVDGYEEGYGKYMNSDGDVYEGEWKNGRQNGKGTMTYADGRVESGIWEDGFFVN